MKNGIETKLDGCLKDSVWKLDICSYEQLRFNEIIFSASYKYLDSPLDISVPTQLHRRISDKLREEWQILVKL